MATITIPKRISQEGDLVVVPRKEYEELVAQAQVNEDDVLRWSREAKRLKRAGKLPALRSLRKL